MQDDRFEWGDAKAARNLREHKVSFEVAREAFDTASFVDQPDDDPDEDRWNRIAEVRGRLITVTYTERGTRLRIISARKATAQERRVYDEQG